MKNLFTFLFALVVSASVSAQVFWTEGFGTGCNQGQFADGVSTTNGTWTVTMTGSNDPEANVWYLSAAQGGTGTGNCATQNCANSNQTIHIGAHDGLSPDDAGATYDAGGLCPYFACVVTDARVESPVINCTGKSSITLKFNYVEGGQGSTDNGTCWYYDGSTWSQIQDMPKTTGCGNGTWKLDSISLPASANNNPNVKIGFRWVNNDDAGGNDPSVAVDDITMSVASGSLPPTASITALTSDSSCAPLCNQYNDNSTGNPTSWLWTFTGPTPSSSTAKNAGVICWDTAGTYAVKLKVSNAFGSDSITIGNLKVVASPPTPTITRSNDTLWCSFDPSYVSYQWFEGPDTLHGETHRYLVIPHSGSFNVSVANVQGCAEAVGTSVGIASYSSDNVISLFPNPAKSELTITGNWQGSQGVLSIYDVLGNKVREESVKLGSRFTYDIKNLSTGVYFLQISNEKGQWTGKFEKY